MSVKILRLQWFFAWSFLLTSCSNGLNDGHDEVCRRAAELCRKTPLVCEAPSIHVTLECGCGCLPSNGVTQSVKAASDVSLKAPISAPSAKAQRSFASMKGLPASNRVFGIDLDDDGVDELIGAEGKRVWVYNFSTDNVEYLELANLGVLQAVTRGKWGEKDSLFFAFGRGRAAMNAPIQVFRSDSAGMDWHLVYEKMTPRSDASGLRLETYDQGQSASLTLSHYTSKYDVVTVAIDPLAERVVHGPQRMASQVYQWQPSGDGAPVKVVGRVYGDRKGQDGDLSIFSSALESEKLSIEGGLRSMVVAKTKRNAPARLYISDGWKAAYAKEGKALLKEVRREGPSYIVNLIGTSPEEYSFLELWNRDLNFDGVDELIVRGDRFLTVFGRTNEGWKQKRLQRLEPVLNVALLRGNLGQWFVAIPDSQKTKLVEKSAEEMAL